MFKTSKLICMILANEGSIELNCLSRYIKVLIQKEYITVDGTRITLTNKGKAYVKM